MTPLLATMADNILDPALIVARVFTSTTVLTFGSTTRFGPSTSFTTTLAVCGFASHVFHF